MRRRFLLATVVVAFVAARALAADAPIPHIAPLRPVPEKLSATARELSPLETGWSWTERVVGTNARIRTNLEIGIAPALPGQPLRVRYWHKRVQLLDAGHGPQSGAVVAVAYDPSGAVVALGELGESEPDQMTKVYDPPRLLMPAVLRADSAWETAGMHRRVIGIADVESGRWRFPRCFVVESAHGDTKPNDRSYLAPGVGEVVTERLGPDGQWHVSTVLEEWTRPKKDPAPSKDEVGV